jgi:para-nitrobenzyl esterase
MYQIQPIIRLICYFKFSYNKILKMKKKITLNHCLLLIAFCLFQAPLSMSAQNALGCNGTRYLNDIFTDTSMTTLQYGSNISYSVNKQLFLDLVQPKTDTLSRRPLIIWAYGGAFLDGNGTRKDMRTLCDVYAKKGYVTSTIDYRLYSFATSGFPDSVKITNVIIQAAQDMKAAVRYFKKTVREDGNPYRIDTSNIIVGGISSGAIMSLIVAQMDSIDPIPTWMRTIITAQGGFEGSSGTPSYSSNVKGAISMSGALYRKEWLDKGDLPYAAYHGTADNTVAYGYGVNVYGFYGDGDGSLAPKAVELGIPTVLVTVPGGGHTDIYPGPTVLPANFPANFVTWMGKMTTFMQRLVCGTTPLLVENVENQEIKIYPNPSNDNMTVELSKNTEGGHYDLTVLDALGRAVYSMKNQTNNTLILQKKDIGTGLFFVRLNFSDGAKPVLKKVIFE